MGNCNLFLPVHHRTHLLLPTWPKFTAACWAEAVKMIIVRYSDSFSLVLMDLGKPEAESWAS